MADGVLGVRTCLLILGIAGAASCVRFDVFACAEDSDCVLNGLSGSCAETGYCGFPDPDCPAGLRYSQHAPGNLAGECVDVAGGSESAGNTGAETSTGGETQTSVATSDTDAEGSGGIEPCVDVDEDGVGVGPGCVEQDCDDDNPATFDGCVYLGPNGDDANSGTSEAPWRTYAHAISQLSPGASLVVLDGRYLESEVGTPFADCEEGDANSGTEPMPIFVRSENDGQVVIDREGRAHGLGTDQCSHWRFRGFSVVSVDNALDDTGAWRSPVAVFGAEDVQVKRVVVHHTNRFFNEHAFMIGGASDVVVEDVELHDFFRSGFSIYASDRVTCRRCYAHSHEVSDLDACPDRPDCADPDDQDLRGTTPCPMCSAGSPDRGDNSFYVEHSNDVLLENCVSEGSARGYQVTGGTGQDGATAGRNIRIVQSLSLGDDRGVVVGQNADNLAPLGMVIENVVVLNSASTGLELRQPDDLVLRDVSVIGSGGDGIRVPQADAPDCTGGECSATFERLLIEGAGANGFSLEVEPQAWSLTHSSINGAEDISFPTLATDDPFDQEGNARSNIEGSATRVGSGDGECRIYVPSDSNMFDPFGDGNSVGANVVELMLDGVPSGAPLWSSDGKFPCIDEPVEPAQIAGEQCGDLADRVGFSGTCEAP
ncbi:MAG: hypothetical protein ACRBN8_12785 [Nannocystales bacterium]